MNITEIHFVRSPLETDNAKTFLMDSWINKNKRENRPKSQSSALKFCHREKSEFTEWFQQRQIPNYFFCFPTCLSHVCRKPHTNQLVHKWSAIFVLTPQLVVRTAPDDTHQENH